MVSDDELYRSYLSGDVSSYDQLMIIHGDALTFYINGYTHNLQDAEDLMIEAFARIMVKKPHIQPGGFKAYLYKTARNLTIRFHQKQKNKADFGLDDLPVELADSKLTEEVVAAEEKKATLHMCLERIEPELKEALWLVYCDGLSYAEAAGVMGVSTKRIDHLLTRGKQQMRRQLEREGIRNAYE